MLWPIDSEQLHLHFAFTIFSFDIGKLQAEFLGFKEIIFVKNKNLPLKSTDWKVDSAEASSKI